MPVAWEKLSPKQQEVITHKEGALLVLAGPGTGKTEVLTQRVAWLVRNGVDPKEILAITFTKKAKDEMVERLSEFEGLEQVVFNVSTLHATALSIIASTGNLRKYVAGADETRIILNDAIDDIKGRSSYSEKKECADWIYSNKYANIDELKCEHEKDEFIKIYQKYEKLLEYNNVQDLTGLVMNTISIIKQMEDLLSNNINHLLVDEYQDINYSEYELIKFLSRGNKSTFLVGDDDQSIYGWRGADPRIMHDYKDIFPDGGVETIEETRRCTGNIIKCAVEIVSKCELYYKKEIKSIKGDGDKISILISRNNEKEAIWIANKINELKEDYSLEDISVLVKQRNRADDIYTQLRRRGINVTFWRPNQMYHDSIIRNIVALLRLIQDREDNLALRICFNGIKKMGVGKKGVKKIRELAESRGTPFWEILANGDSIAECGRWGKVYKKYSEFIDELEQELVDLPISKKVERISQVFISEETGNVRSLLEMAESLPEDAPISTFIEEYNERRGKDVEKPEETVEDGMNIMSMHASKGLGFQIVFVVGFEATMFPNEAQNIDEQRRLCYVAMTRAKNQLFLCYSNNIVGPAAQGFKVYGPSQFLLEIPVEDRIAITNN